MSADRNPQVMEMVRNRLNEDPAISNDALYQDAVKIDRSISDLTLRQFHARYPLQVKRKWANEGGPPTGNGGNGGSTPKAQQVKDSLPEVRSVFDGDRPIRPGEERRASGEIISVFAGKTDLFTTYHVELSFVSKLFGGIPGNPEIIESWLRAKAGVTEDDEELRFALIRTLGELGADVSPEMSFEQIVEASGELAKSRNTNMFKRDPELGLYVESRQIKAMLKESTGALYASERFGPTRKGTKSFVAEHVFVEPERIPLDRQHPDSVELMVGHVSGPGGSRSTLTYHETVHGVVLRFRILADHLAEEELTGNDRWPVLWTHAEQNGLGAVRSQGHGKFRVTRWEREG